MSRVLSKCFGRRATPLITFNPISQKRTLYFCGPKAGDHPTLMPHHYFAGLDPERWTTSAADRPVKLALLSSEERYSDIPLNPAAYMDERSIIEREISRLEDLLKERSEDRWERVARECEERRKEIGEEVERLSREKRYWEMVWKERYAWGEGI